MIILRAGVQAIHINTLGIGTRRLLAYPVVGSFHTGFPVRFL